MENNVFNINEFDNYFRKNLVIEASAGTGKTYSIQKIVTELVKRDIDIRKIVIVTYTEKATGELRDRIRKELDNNPRVSKEDLDNLNIFTFHSFCQNVVKEFGKEANFPLDLEVINEQDALEKYIDLYMRTEPICTDLGILNSIATNFNLTTFKKTLIELCLKYYLGFDKLPISSIATFSVDDPDKILERTIRYGLCKDFDELCSYDEEVKYYYNILKNGGENGPEVAEKIKEKFEESHIVSNWGFRTNKKRSDEENLAISFFTERKHDLSLDGKFYILALCQKYINDLYLKWQKEKLDNKQQAFSDMIRNVRETLYSGNELFKNALKEKFTYAIIDEFQDTNKIEFDIFSAIFMDDDKHNIIVVGDPKQSIYSFQGADVNAYLTAKEIISNSKNGMILRLDTNYRSSKAMIESCNSFFKSNDNFFLGNIKFEESKCPKDNKAKITFDGEEIDPLWFVKMKCGEGITNIDYQGFSRMVTSTIAECCSKDESGHTRLQLFDKDGVQRNVKFSDFVILYCARPEADNVIYELSRCGIPYVKYKDTGLLKSHEAACWAAILNAIDIKDFTGFNRGVLKRALFTDFFARSLNDLNKEYFNHDDIYEVEIINNWKSLAENRRWEELIDSILNESWLLNNLQDLNNLQSLTVYRQIGDFCISYLYDNHTLHDLALFLQGSTSDDDVDEDKNTVEIGTDLDAVKMMTIYASKGLQFPIVISFAGVRDSNRKGLVFITDEETENRKIVDATDEKAQLFSIQELMRLIYVCYTRAIYLNIMPIFQYKVDSIYLHYDSIVNSYLESGNSCLKYVFDNKQYYKSNIKKQIEKILFKQNIEQETWEEQQKKLNSLINKNNSLKTYKHSYSSLSHGDEENNIVFEDDINLEGSEEAGLARFDKSKIVVNGKRDTTLSHLPYDGIPRGASIGTALHEIFEKMDFTNPNNNIDVLIKERLEINKIQINDNIIEYIKKMVENVLSSNLPIINGSIALKDTFKLSMIPNKDKLPEIEFNFNLLNDYFKNYCNGFIDLLFRRGEFYSILDWKSDTLNDDEFISYSDSESLNNHTNDRYSIQRVLYSYCLIKWLKNYYQESSEEIFNNHFGGIYYVYLRGCNKDTSNGIYAQTWNSFKDLENEFNKIMKEKIGG